MLQGNSTEYPQHMFYGEMWKIIPNLSSTGADPGFLNRGFKFAKGGSIWSIYPTFLKIPNKNEIIWTQSAVWANTPNPLWTATDQIATYLFLSLTKPKSWSKVV